MGPIFSRSDWGKVAVLTWDDPDRPLNVKSQAAIVALNQQVEEVLNDDHVDGYVIASGKARLRCGR